MAKYYFFCSKSSELVRIKTPCYSVIGLPAEFYDIDFISHKDPTSMTGWWAVTHVLSGHNITRGRTRKAAEDGAIEKLKRIGVEKTRLAIKRAMERVAAGAETA